MRLILSGGAYSARSVIANAQRRINLYPERNPKDSPVPVTFYQRPGLKPLAAPANPGPARGAYRASNGNCYYVVNQDVYQVTGQWVLTKLGTMAAIANNPVSMIDNGVTLVIGDGSAQGYQVNLNSGAFSTIVDPTGTFAGTRRWDVIDGFLIWPIGGTQWGSSLSGVVTFLGTFIGNKSDYPDPLVTLAVIHHEILLLGALKGEIWYDAGNTLFPFGEIPGAYVEHGIMGQGYSLATMDGAAYWLGQDLQGDGIVFRQRGYETKRISNHALEDLLQKYKVASGTIADAIGYTYQQDGHYFYVLTFPTADVTWVFDESMGDPNLAWHQRGWLDTNGLLHRERANCCANFFGYNVVGDWENGTLYAMDLNTYSDTVAGIKGPTLYLCSFPHILAGMDGRGQVSESNGRLVEHYDLTLDIECGSAPADAQGNPAMISVRYSDDRGRTWSSPVTLANNPGAYLTMPKLAGLGQARDRVYEVSHNFDGPGALNGAWINGKILEQ